MKTKVDEIYEDVKSIAKYKKNLFTDSSKKNIQILSELIRTVNIAKCELFDLDVENPFGSLYLMYLLQSKDKIPFGICESFKIWYNLEEGVRMSCIKKGNAYLCKGLAKKCNIKK